MSIGNGKAVATRRLFRSDSLKYASDSDVHILRDKLAIRTIIDLRSPKERPTVGWMSKDKCNYVNIPIIGDPGAGFLESNEPGTWLIRRYIEYLELSGQNIVRALLAIANAVRCSPAMYHCVLGKDRTGVVTALLLSTLGVDDETIIEDYALTQTNMPHLLARIAKNPGNSRISVSRHSELYRAEEHTMRSFLKHLHEQHQGAASWLLKHGLPEHDLLALEKELVISKPVGR